MQAVILAGGLATRLGELTKNTPKSLIEIEGQPFLGHQLTLLRNNGIRNVVLAIGHFGEQIRERFGDGAEYGVKIQYSVEKDLLGTAGAIKNAAPLLEDEFFVLYGDSYLCLDYMQVYKFFKQHQRLALMTVYQNFDLYDRSNTSINGTLVVAYDKKNTNHDMAYIDYGLNLFRKKVLELIPVNTVYSLEAVFQQLIQQQQLLAYVVKERFYEIGSLTGLKECATFIRSKK